MYKKLAVHALLDIIQEVTARCFRSDKAQTASFFEQLKKQTP